MNIEIKLHNYQVTLENIIIPDYTSRYEEFRRKFENHKIDFSSISKLKGEKTMLENSFQQTKKELLDYGQ
jgi:hypothetical protein